jgi:hypothetical protein
MKVRSERSTGGGGQPGSSNRIVLTLASSTSDGAVGAGASAGIEAAA